MIQGGKGGFALLREGMVAMKMSKVFDNKQIMACLKVRATYQLEKQCNLL